MITVDMSKTPATKYENDVQLSTVFAISVGLVVCAGLGFLGKSGISSLQDSSVTKYPQGPAGLAFWGARICLLSIGGVPLMPFYALSRVIFRNEPLWTLTLATLGGKLLGATIVFVYGRYVMNPWVVQKVYSQNQELKKIVEAWVPYSIGMPAFLREFGLSSFTDTPFFSYLFYTVVAELAAFFGVGWM